MKKQAIVRAPVGGADDVLPPEVMKALRERETYLIETIAGQLEDFRLQVLAQGHGAAPIEVGGGHHTYFCPKCKCGARLTVSFNAGELKFDFTRSGSALKLTCHEALKKQAVASFKATALAMFEVEVRGYGRAMRQTGHRPDIGRLITLGRRDFTRPQYNTAPATDAGQNEENDE